MRYPVFVDGFEGRDVAVELAGFFSSTKLVVDGTPATKGRKAGEYVLTRNDGHEVAASVQQVFFLDPVPQLIVEGKNYQLAEPLRWYQWVWSGIPVLLFLSGGALGALWGAFGLYLNSRLFRSKLNPIVKYGATGMITAAAALLFLGSAMLFNRVITELFARPVTVQSAAGRFSVVAPIDLKEQTEEVTWPTGDVATVHTFLGERAGIAYFITYADYPASLVRTRDPQDVLEASQDGVILSIDGTFVDGSAITLGDHRGLEFRVDAKDENAKPYQLRARLYLVGLRLYQVFVVVPAGVEAGKDVDTFFSSFAVATEP